MVIGKFSLITNNGHKRQTKVSINLDTISYWCDWQKEDVLASEIHFIGRNSILVDRKEFENKIKSTEEK